MKFLVHYKNILVLFLLFVHDTVFPSVCCQAYVVFLTEMGGVWVGRNLATITRHVLELVSHPKTTQSHIDAVYSRQCVGFIFRSVFGKLLGESAQFVAAKQLCQLIVAMLTTPTSSSVGGGISVGEGEQPLEGSSGGGATPGGGGEKKTVNQHAVICSMLEIGLFNLMSKMHFSATSELFAL